MDIDEAGKVAYEAYAKVRDYTARDGSPLREWDAMDEDIRAAWGAAAISGAAYVATKVMETLAAQAQERTGG